MCLDMFQLLQELCAENTTALQFTVDLSQYWPRNSNTLRKTATYIHSTCSPFTGGLKCHFTQMCLPVDLLQQ